MLKYVIRYSTLLLLYLLCYYCLNLIPGITGFTVSFLLILLIVTSLSFLVRTINALVYRFDMRFSWELEKLFMTFDQRLNESNDYHELLKGLTGLFNQISKKGTWAFYVFEEDDFHIASVSATLEKNDLPFELAGSQFTDLDFTHRLSDLNLKNLGQFDHLIVFPGKTRPFGLFFTQSASLNYLNDRNLRTIFSALVQKAGQILENTALYLDIIEKNRQIKMIFEVSQKILTSLNTNQILDFLLDSLDQIIPFDAGVIFLFDDETKQLRHEVTKGYGSDVNLTLKLGQGACGWVAENRKISLIEDISLSDTYYPARQETRSQVALPLEIFDELIGVLCLESNSLGHFTQKSQEILNLFANQAAIALNNAKQYEISLKKQYLEHEMIRAGKIQQVLLPSHPPTYTNLNISFAHIPSEIVSGDLFDLVTLNQTTLGVLVGDVSGKGAHAAIMMSLVLAGFRAFSKAHLTVCEVAARLNNLLEESISVGNYTTLFYALISLEHNKITYTNAGHNPPLLMRSDGTLIELSGGGILLGFLRDQTFVQNEVEFKAGDTLIAFTDGITEAMDLDENEFGEDRLRKALLDNRHLNSYDLKEKLLKTVTRFTHRKNQTDDMTLVIIKHT